MSTYTEPIGRHQLNRLLLGLIACISLIALAVLAGWQWDIVFLRSPIPGLSAMNPTTALCLVLVAVSFLALAFPGRSPVVILAGRMLAVVVLSIGLARTAGYFIPVLAGIDHLLMIGSWRDADNQIAVTTAFCLVCSSAALMLVRSPKRPNRILLQTFVLIMAGMALLSLLGYIYRVREFNGILQYARMAIHTAACFLLLSFAFLLAKPDQGIMRDLTGSDWGGLTARRLMPFAFLAPVVLGWVRLWAARRGAFSVEFGVSALVLSIIICFVFLVWYNARLLNKRDVLQRKVQEELRASEKRFGLLVGSIKDYAIFLVDPGGRIISWNPGAQAIKGYTAEEIIGQHISIFYTAEEISQDIPRHNLELARQYGTHHSDGWRLRKNGTKFWADIVFTALYDDDHRLQGFAKITRDVTERRLHEEKIADQARQLQQFNEDLAGQVREKTAELASVFERLSEGFMAIRGDGLITYANRRAAEMNRRSIGELVGRNFWTEFPTAVTNAFGEHFREAVGRQENQHFEMYSPSLRLWIECALYPAPGGVSLFFRDITEQYNAREMVNRSNAELRALASHLQNIREEERSGIAREIHDELGQQLTGLKMDVSWLAEKLTEAGNAELKQKMDGTLELFDHAIMTVRKIATELRPSILDDLGLIAAMEWQAEEFQKRSGIETCFRAGMASRRYPSAMSIGLFRICQEALTNVARHSGAKRVEIFLGYDEDRIVLRVSDDGRGLNPGRKAGAPKTLGLLGMKERALMMDGTLEIASEPGKGLTLNVSVPITILESP